MIKEQANPSYILGSYVGLCRQIEKELDRLMKKNTESAVEDLLSEFEENPLESFNKCQEIIKSEQKTLISLDKLDLITECGEILKMIDIEAVEYMNLDVASFLHGYHAELDQHHS